MGQESEYVFDNHQQEKKGKLAGLGKFLWNGRTKEFCGRDGASWAKLSIFYAIFYTCLGAFFIGMLAVFVHIMPKDKPTYYGDSSVMNSRGLNPGLGFRPQIDVEDSLIKYNPVVYDDAELGSKKYITNLEQFLAAKYNSSDPNLQRCSDPLTPQDLDNGKSCEFNYESIFSSSPCTKENSFGYKTKTACFLLKLNKIVSWTPKFEDGQSSIIIKCAGETSADKDNIKKIIYHSEGDIKNESEGKILSKYYPFNAQKNYQSPFIFVQIDVNLNTLINVECKAYAANIDNSDRMNRRGMTKFTLYVES